MGASLIKVHAELPLRNSSSTLFQKYRVFYKKNIVCSDLFQLIVFLLLNGFFTSESLTPQCPCMLKPFYAVSWVRCYFGYILIISACGLASEPETQSETGEIMVKVFDTHSKYFEDICPRTWLLKLLNSFNLVVIEMEGSIMIFGQNGFPGGFFPHFQEKEGSNMLQWESCDNPDGPAFCNWSSGLAGLLEMIIRMSWPFSNDHLDGPAFCK